MTTLEKLREKEGFYEGYPLSNLTTLGLGGPAKYFFLPESYEDLQDAYLFFKEEGVPVKIIGNGSNILISDNGVDAAVMSLKRLPREIQKYSSFLHCSANNPISSILMFCEKVKLSGLEFLVGIPATLGGACMMNAGAFSKSIGDLIENIEVLLEDGTICTINKKQLRFSYRTSSLEGKIVLSVDLKLDRSYYRAIRRIKKKKLAYRNTHHPVNEPNLGSVFKNPENEKAGRLIEQAGLKGHTVGGARVSEKHANFFVIDDTATANDYYQLIQHVQRVVADQSGFVLEPEVLFWGDFL